MQTSQPKQTSLTEIAALRRAMRARRNALPLRYRALAAERVVSFAVQRRLLRPGMWIGAYLPFGSELNVLPLMLRAVALGCEVFVPRIANERARRMEFARWTPSAITRSNRFGIHEPRKSHRNVAALRRLDVIFLPLVAFSADGWRLGSGAGFYDRRLALRRTSSWRRPRLIGVAYDAQRVNPDERQAELRPWDVPLDAALTESGFYPSSRSQEESR